MSGHNQCVHSHTKHEPDTILLFTGIMYSTAAAPCASSLLLVKVINTGESSTLRKSTPCLKGSHHAH